MGGSLKWLLCLRGQKITLILSSRSPKPVDLCTNQIVVYDFLFVLVINMMIVPCTVFEHDELQAVTAV